MRTVLRLAAAAGLAASGAAATAAAETGVTDDSIKIGSFGPMTGPYYIFGDLIMDGAEVVYKLVNETGGIHGRKIEFVREDDRCDSQTGVTAAKKLIHQEQVFMIHGGGCSNPAIAARPEIIEAEVPWVIFASIADSHTNPTRPNIWRTSLNATVESQAQVQYAIDRSGGKNIGIIYTNDPWGRERMDAIDAYFEKQNVEPVAKEELALDSNDATPQVLRLRQAGVETVVLVVYPKPAAVFMRDAAKLDFRPLLVGTTAVSGIDKLREQVGMGDQAVEKLVAVSHVAFTQEEAPMLVWKKVFAQYYPDKEWTVYPLFGIPSALVVVEALQRAGRDLTRESFRQAMDDMRGYLTGVYAGPITCTPERHQCNHTAAMVGMRNGQLVTVGVAEVTQ